MALSPRMMSRGVSATNSEIQDKLVELSNGAAGTPDGDAGLIIERGSSDNVFIGWDESEDKVTVATTSATGASTGDLTLTAADLACGDITVSGGDVTFGAVASNVKLASTAHGVVGAALTVAAGAPTAGTTNNIAGGVLTLAGGQGKGSGAGGNIVFQTAAAGSSGSVLNALSTALTIDATQGATVAGDIAVSGGDVTLGTAGNTTATTITTIVNTSTTVGKDLTISAGSTTVDGNNLNGGDLILASGGGDGTGTSTIQLKTKINGTDAAGERMRIHTDGNVGIGSTDPSTLLEIKGADAYLTLENTTNEHGDGQAESRVNFNDHSGTTMAVIEGSHYGASDDSFGQIKFMCYDGTGYETIMKVDKDGELTLNYRPADGGGSGFDAAANRVSVDIAKINGQIITTILVNLEGLDSTNSDKQIIGENGVANAYITKLTTAKNGYIYRAEMGCIQTPGNGEPDIDLVSSTQQSPEGSAYDASGTNVQMIAAGGDWVRGMWEASAKNPAGGSAMTGGLHDHYLYLVTGTASGTVGATYDAGQFVIKLYGGYIDAD